MHATRTLWRLLVPVAALALAVLPGCDDDDSGSTADLLDDADTAADGDTSADTSDTSGDTGDTGDTDDTSPGDLTDTGDDTQQDITDTSTQDLGDTSDTSDATDTTPQDTAPDMVMAPCGNGTVDIGEQCDDGNTATGDGCDDGCRLEPSATCGDGTVDAGEQCDDGALNSDVLSDACRTNCADASCGDAVLDLAAAEQCDDGNVTAGDGCTACVIDAPASCGDGMLDLATGEECDDGNTAPGDGCGPNCQLETVGASCGDTMLDPLEVCDDGNTTNGDGCNPTCNLTGTVTNILANGTPIGAVGALVASATHLYIGDNQNFVIWRIPLSCVDMPLTCTPELVAGIAGTQGYVNAAAGATAQLGFVGTMATDGATLWFADAHTLRAVDLTPPHAVTTVAGDPSVTDRCDVVDATGTAARFHDVRGLTWYAGHIYLVDGCMGVLRRVDPTTGEVVTLAGQASSPSNPAAPACPSGIGSMCNPGTPADGFGTAAVFDSPRYMTSDGGGMLYVTDTNGETIRTFNTVTGWVGTLAGGSQGYVDAVGTAAQLGRPRGLVSDGTSVYWAEQVEATVRQLVLSTAAVSTLAGQRGCVGSREGTGARNTTGNCNAGGTAGLPRFDTPFNLAWDPTTGSIFVGDSFGLRRIQ